MRKIYSFFFTSLDGFHETRDHDIDWQDVDDEFDDFDLAQLDEAGTILLGRVTYDGFAEFWSSAAAEKADPVRVKLLNELPKVVVSRTLQEVTWQNTTIIGSDTDVQIRALKEQSGKDIEVIGSANAGRRLVIGTLKMVAFDAPDHRAHQQMHLCVHVTDIDDAEPKALAIGATRLPGRGDSWRVYADPSGHPFCLTW